jgi:stage II sporulation protein D
MKKVLFVIVLLLQTISFPSIPVRAQMPDLVRVGLERQFRNVHSITLSNTHIHANGHILQSAGGFTVRLDGGRVVLISGGNTVLTEDGSNGILVRDAEGGPVNLGNARFRGAVQFIRGSGVSAVNILTADEYLYGVVASEMPAGFHREALKAQAVAARSYMLNRMGIHSAQGYDLCDLGHCQAYRGMGQEHTGAVEAVNETRGLIMYHENEPINAVYFSSSGGVTDNSENVWNEALPYLRGVVEITEFEPRIWNRYFTWAEITGFLSANNINIGSANGMAITRFCPAGRVQELTVYGTGGQRALVKEDIRTVFSPSAGGMLESRNFTLGSGFTPLNPVLVSVTDGLQTQHGIINSFYVLAAGGLTSSLSSASVTDGFNIAVYEAAARQQQTVTVSGGAGVTISGSGWGHGVGMSQRGAEGMALMGYSFWDILHHYYKGIVIR